MTATAVSFITLIHGIVPPEAHFVHLIIDHFALIFHRYAHIPHPNLEI
ncbi:MAG: hypothetical protein WCG25_00155 [bacterium]